MKSRKGGLIAAAVSASALICLSVLFHSLPALIPSHTAAGNVSEPISSEAVPTAPASSPTPAPAPTPEPVFEEYDITLMAVGDNLMHMSIVKTGFMDDGTYDYTFLFEPIRSFLDAADISVINQETILGGNELGFSGFPRFNSPTEIGDAIADAGFDVVLHASNHAADQGLSGLYSCAAFWAESHPEVLMVGITGDSGAAQQGSDTEETDDIPLLTAGGFTFAILNYTYGPNAATISSSLREHLNMLCAYDEKSGKIDFTSLNPQVVKDIEKAKTLADICIVFPHWGNEYQTDPSGYQKQFALEMTQAGADLIIGTHPHVPQPLEKVTSENGNTSLCYYSLGNYVSTQQQPICMLEEMAWVTFHVTEEGISIAEDRTGVLPLVCQYKMGPLRLQDVYFLEDYTEELAKSHGIRSWGGQELKLSDLQRWRDEIMGDWVLLKSDVLDSDSPVSQ